jgi:hypothetical protein
LLRVAQFTFSKITKIIHDIQNKNLNRCKKLILTHHYSSTCPCELLKKCYLFFGPCLLYFYEYFQKIVQVRGVRTSTSAVQVPLLVLVRVVFRRYYVQYRTGYLYTYPLSKVVLGTRTSTSTPDCTSNSTLFFVV